MNIVLRDKIRVLLQEGKTKKQIAEELGVSTTTVRIYATDESFERYSKRINSDSYKEKNKIYHKEYMKKRYQNDEEFRKRIKIHQKKYRAKQEEKNSEVVNNEDN